MEKLTPEQIEEIRSRRKARAERIARRRLIWAKSREYKSEEAYKKADQMVSNIPLGQPILVDHYSAKAHRAYLSKIDSNMHRAINNSQIAQLHREKAENILIYGTRVQGDAEHKREIQRVSMDKIVKLGSRVIEGVFGEGIVMKINRKTYTIQFKSGSTMARDKSYIVKVIEE